MYNRPSILFSKQGHQYLFVFSNTLLHLQWFFLDYPLLLRKGLANVTVADYPYMAFCMYSFCRCVIADLCCLFFFLFLLNSAFFEFLNHILLHAANSEYFQIQKSSPLFFHLLADRLISFYSKYFPTKDQNKR